MTHIIRVLLSAPLLYALGWFGLWIEIKQSCYPRTPTIPVRWFAITAAKFAGVMMALFIAIGAMQ